MNAPSIDIQSILRVVWLKDGTPPDRQPEVYVGKEPEFPHQVVTVYDTPGYSPWTSCGLDNPSVQVRVRGNPNDYTGAYALALKVRNALHAFQSYQVGDTYYVGIVQQGEIESLGYDEQNRPIFVMNLNIHREGPVAGTNRGVTP